MPIDSRTTVLIVDDDEAIADTLAAIFRMHGYDARVAYSAEEAIENIATCVPDMALLDVNLPGMNGIDLAIVMRANHPACHLLLVSGHEKTSILLEEAAKKGYMFDILAKPIHPTFILERVKGLMSGSRGAMPMLTDYPAPVS
ncbi:MAG TPA: response regulator [Acidobacteriaceae bacterium]|jgi:DNA-binding response OmpR family regulator|nr:response regulator [Acidobacteriaceae bacterium]